MTKERRRSVRGRRVSISTGGNYPGSPVVVATPLSDSFEQQSSDARVILAQSRIESGKAYIEKLLEEKNQWNGLFEKQQARRDNAERLVVAFSSRSNFPKHLSVMRAKHTSLMGSSRPMTIDGLLLESRTHPRHTVTKLVKMFNDNFANVTDHENIGKMASEKSKLEERLQLLNQDVERYQSVLNMEEESELVRELDFWTEMRDLQALRLQDLDEKAAIQKRKYQAVSYIFS